MKKIFTLFLFLLFIAISNNADAQLSGSKSIPGDYATIEAAITDLNFQGVGAGGVTFNVATGHTETFTSPLAGVITATGTDPNQIIFQKSGGLGANPLITSGLGTITTSTTLGANGDGIIIIEGGDYITFDGIDLQENPVAVNEEKMEVGYYIKKASGDDACKNVTIKNCTITLDKATRYCWGIYVSNYVGATSVTVTSIGGRSENIKIFNNTISNVYGGIQLRGFISTGALEFYDHNIEVGVDGPNVITNYGGGASTAYGFYSIYQNNLKVANNTINGGAGTTTILYGIFNSTGTNSNVDIYNNTVTIEGSATTSTIYAINNSMGSTGTDNTVNIYNNIVENCSYPTATTGAMYHVYNLASAFNVNMYDNIVRNNSKPGTSGAMYLLYNSSGGVNGFANIYNNTVHGNTNGATGVTYCIWSNEVATSTKMVYNNTVYNNTGGGDIHGIASALGIVSHVYMNNIYDITSTTTGTVSPYPNGITITSGTEVYVYNNFISDLKAPNSAAIDAVRGISMTTATTNAIRGIYYNTIYLNATSSGTNFGSSGIFHILSATATSSTLDMRNNNIVNNSTPNGTGFTVAFRRSAATSLNNYSETSNNNNFYGGPPGPSNLLFYDGTNEIQSMGDFKILVNPRESASVTGFPPFVNIITPPYNLHIDPASPTQLESAGQIISAPIAITTDYDGDARYPNAGYPLNPSFPPTAPDIGADEFGGIPADLSPPDIIYSQLNNTASTGNRTLTATITDGSGVQVGVNGPRLYYKKSTDPSYIFDDNPSIFGDEYTFTLNTALLGGVTLGTEIEYYVAAQDLAGNAGTNPSGGSGVNPPGTIPPGSPNSYTIVSGISGTFTVGATGDYLNLTAIANFLNSPNVEVTGNTIFELQNDYDGSTGETVPIVFNEFLNAGTSGTPFTVTIRPALGVTGRLTSGDPGSNFAFPVINFVGGKYFILDGRPGGLGSSKEWTIRNTRDVATIGCVVRFANDGAYNTLQYLNLESQATLTTTGIVFFHTSTGSVGNSFNSILNNNFQPRTDVGSPSFSNGILSNGSLAAPNTGNTVSDNHFINFNNIGISLVTTNTGNGPDWVITGNHLYNPTHTSTTTQTGIASASAASTNMLISGNFVGGSGPNATGSMSNSGNVLVTGILVSGGTATVSNNVVANISGTGTGTATRIQGISQTSIHGASEISNNTIMNLSTTGTSVGTAFGNQTARGIYIGPSGQFVGTNIIGNTIDNISAETTNALITSNVATGMALYNLQNSIVANNKIFNIKNKSTGTTSGQFPIASGIFTSFFSNAVVVNNMISLGSNENTNTQFTGLIHVGEGGSNNHHFYYNSIAITGTAGGSISSFGFLRGNDASIVQNQVMILRDNIFSVDRAGGGSTNYAIGNKGSAAGSGWSSDYNDLYNPGGSIGYWDNTGYTFPGWQIASSGDANSVSKIVFFIDVTMGDLHLTGTSNGDLDLSGIPIAGITTDFDGDTRNEVVPYMGADEASIPLPVELATFTASVDRRDVHLNWTTASEINNSGFDIERKPVGAEEWSRISFVEGSGTTNEATNYSFTDRGLNSGKYNYRLKQVDYNGNFEYFNLSSEVNVGVPDKYDLSQNYPNPFNPTTKINFDLPFDSKVTMKIFDITGREIKTLVNEVHQAGYYTVTFDAGSIASGVYFYRIIAEGGNEQYVMTKKMMVIK
jgi:trimeric autotransporter adhesin